MPMFTSLRIPLPRAPLGRRLVLERLAVAVVLLASLAVRTNASDIELEPHRPWMVSFGLVSPSLGMSLYQDGLAHRVRFKSNNPPHLNLGLWHEGLGGSIGFGSGRMKEEIDLDTRYLDLQLFLTFPRMAVDVYWQRYEGYYSEDEEHGKIAIHPGATMTTQGLNAYHKLVGNVDLMALRSPHQERRFLSYLLYTMASVSHRRLESPTGIVPTGQWENYPRLADLGAVDQSNASLSLGLLVPIHLWIFHFDPAFSFGFGIPIDHEEGRVGKLPGGKVNMKLRAGVAGPRGGFDVNIDADSDAMERRDGATFQFHSLRIGFEGSRRF